MTKPVSILLASSHVTPDTVLHPVGVGIHTLFDNARAAHSDQLVDKATIAILHNVEWRRDAEALTDGLEVIDGLLVSLRVAVPLTC